jgi:hypothetical protein
MKSRWLWKVTTCRPSNCGSYPAIFQTHVRGRECVREWRYVREERSEEAARATAQASAEVVQNQLWDVRGGLAMAGDLRARFKAAKLVDM